MLIIIYVSLKQSFTLQKSGGGHKPRPALDPHANNVYVCFVYDIRIAPAPPLYKYLGNVRFGKSSFSFFVQTLRMVQGIMSENIFEKFAVFTEIFAFK